MIKKGSHLNRYPQIATWITRAVTNADRELPGVAIEPEEKMRNLSEADALLIAVDLDGILDSANLISDEISKLLNLDPDIDDLEEALVNVEIDLAHAVRHWKSSLKVLRSKYDWLPEPEFERATRPRKSDA
ncbi:MAG TPA: hypothetical protein VGS61_04545 [Acidimicrobiales bacterium]|nr:hypothetical protein [Acidimicrobiales bacterium]